MAAEYILSAAIAADTLAGTDPTLARLLDTMRPALAVTTAALIAR